MLSSLSNALWQKALLRREEQLGIERQERQELLRRHYEQLSRLYRLEKREGGGRLLAQLSAASSALSSDHPSSSSSTTDPSSLFSLVRYAKEGEAVVVYGNGTNNHNNSTALRALSVEGWSGKAAQPSGPSSSAVSPTTTSISASCVPSPRLRARIVPPSRNRRTTPRSEGCRRTASLVVTEQRWAPSGTTLAVRRQVVLHL